MSLAVSVASLEPFDKAGWMIKQGGSIKTWKRRWGVLQGNTLWYFKTKNDTEATGFIIMNENSFVHDESKKRKNMISVNGRGYKRPRVFFIYFDSPKETQEWMEALQKAVALGSAIPSNKTNGAVKTRPEDATVTVIAPDGKSKVETSVARAKIAAAKGCIPFMEGDASAVCQCWKLWSEGILPKSEIPTGEELRYRTVANATFSFAEWCVSGPQTAVVQRVVDFFWAVGAPSTQIEFLNNVGTALNPERLGFWTRLGAHNAMDAGWSFCEKMPLDSIIGVLAKTDSLKAVAEWASSNSITICREIMYDISGIPPQMIELRFELPGGDAVAQVAVFQETMKRFSMPAIPEEQIDLFRSLQTTEKHPLQIILVLTEAKVIRASLFVRNPSLEMVKTLLQYAQGNQEIYDSFSAALDSPLPHNLLLSYTIPGMGYKMYKDGYDVMFGWDAGSEKMDS